MDLSSFNEALNRLDAEIAEAEERLADLQLKRKGAEAFLVYMQTPAPAAQSKPNTAPAPAQRSTAANGPVGVTDFAESVSRAHADAILTIDFVWEQAQAQGRDFTREQVKNALYYLARKGVLVSLGGGSWQLATTDAETPVAAGASVGTVRLGWEGGDSSETTAATASPAEDQRDLQLGASITEVAS